MLDTLAGDLRTRGQAISASAVGIFYGFPLPWIGAHLLKTHWPLVLGGKPVGSIPPYVVIMFEMTILFGALATILGILFNALFAARRLGTVAYDARFTNDKFGVFVPCEPARAGQVEALLRGTGAEEVRRA